MQTEIEEPQERHYYITQVSTGTTMFEGWVPDGEPDKLLERFLKGANDCPMETLIDGFGKVAVKPSLCKTRALTIDRGMGRFYDAIDKSVWAINDRAKRALEDRFTYGLTEVELQLKHQYQASHGVSHMMHKFKKLARDLKIKPKRGDSPTLKNFLEWVGGKRPKIFRRNKRGQYWVHLPNEHELEQRENEPEEREAEGLT